MLRDDSGPKQQSTSSLDTALSLQPWLCISALLLNHRVVLHRLIGTSYCCHTDWVEMEDHTKGFMNAPIYSHFNNDLMSSLLDSKPIVYMTHFTFPTSPSELASARHPTLQILQTSLSPDTNAEDALAALQPIEEIWKASDRRYVLAQALDEDMQDRTLLVVAWRDVLEAKTAKQDPEYLNKFIPCKKHWKDVQLFGHIKPSYAPPQLDKQQQQDMASK